MTTFFSVDVETSNTNRNEGLLLTVGIVPVRWEPGATPVRLPTTFYARIDQSELLEPHWYEAPETPEGIEAAAKDDTFQWWSQQSEAAKGEAWLDPTLVRLDDITVARMLREWVLDTEPEYAQRIFVANPVAFDKPWIDDFLELTLGQSDLFHYRSLCLRSMKFGLRKDSGFGSDRENHEPKIPHHSLHDADAQAQDLIDMLVERDDRF